MQTCGIVIILVILISFLIKKKMITRSNIIFLEMLIVGIVFLVFIAARDEFIKTPLEKFDEGIPVVLAAKWLARIVLMLGITINYLLLRYLSNDAFKGHPIKRTVINIVATIFGTAALVLAASLPIVIKNQGTVQAYTTGPAFYTSYGIMALFLVPVYLFTLIKENQTSKKRKRTFRVWFYIWAITIPLELFINNVCRMDYKLSALGFISAVGIMIIYLVLENPDYVIDRETWLFSQTKCMEYIYDLHRKNKEYYLLLVITDLTNPMLRNYKSKQDILFSYARSIEKIKRLKAFKGDNDTFIVVSKKIELIDQCINHLNEQYNLVNNQTSEYELAHNIKFLKVENPQICSESSDVLDILREEESAIRFNHNSSLVTVLNDELVNKMNEDKRIEGIVNEAIKEDRILVYLQPIYSLPEKKFVSAEALTRIMDKDGKIIYPGAFIEVCEKNGSIFKLGTLVFEHICRFIQRYNMEALGLHYIEVNMSALQCEYDGIADLFISIMETYNVNPKYINLEITETGNASREKMIANMKKLVDYGVSFSLDDFGTGNSNLNYIVDMPVEIVKFDKQMVTAYFEDKKAKFVMNSAITMIKDMDLKIVLEGIENKNEIQAIQRRKEKIDYIQGYYYSKPIPEDEFVEFIKTKNKVKEEIENEISPS